MAEEVPQRLCPLGLGSGEGVTFHRALPGRSKVAPVVGEGEKGAAQSGQHQAPPSHDRRAQRRGPEEGRQEHGEVNGGGVVGEGRRRQSEGEHARAPCRAQVRKAAGEPGHDGQVDRVAEDRRIRRAQELEEIGRKDGGEEARRDLGGARPHETGGQHHHEEHAQGLARRGP